MHMNYPWAIAWPVWSVAVYEAVGPRHFSGIAEGACVTCGGLVKRSSSNPTLVPDPSKSVKNGALKAWRLGSKQMIIKHNTILKQLPVVAF